MSGIQYNGLYVHVPFCVNKCDYCAFYSVAAKPDGEMVTKWLDKVVSLLESHSPALQKVDTVYFGGGTPTFPDEKILLKLFDAVRKSVKTVPDCEITLESNPETVTPDKAEVIASFANRISMGIQSFNAKTRARLGRRTGTKDDVARAVELYRKAGIKNLGFDLIYAVPGQTMKEWEDDLVQATAFAPEHVSAYSVIPEDGTPFAEREKSFMPSDALSYDMWCLAEEILSKNGLARYEISNYAKNGMFAHHNMDVWHGKTYLGIGPSASSFDGKMRFTQKSSLTAFLDGEEPDYDPLPPDRRAREIFIMGLRTVRGWEESEFEAATGFSFDLMEKELNTLEDDKLLIREKNAVRLTKKGLAFWNEAAERLI